MPPRTVVRIATALTLLLAAAPLAAQDAPAAPQPAAPQDIFVERIAVDVVNVEVYVTDRNGEPVTDLGRDDFEVTEDGKPVEVVNFFHVAEGRAAIEPEPTAAEMPEPEPAVGIDRVDPIRTAAAAVPESQRLHLIVYVDNYHIHPLNRNRVFKRLRSFLASTVKEGDEVMVASYDRSLHIRHPFTRDPNLVNRVLLDLEEYSGAAVERESERSAAIQAIYDEETSLRRALSRAKEFSDAGYHELHLALDGLSELIDSLAGLPGRKMLLHVSDGLPMIPGQDLYQAIQQRFADLSALGEAASRDMSRRFLQIISRANTNRTSFYTIDAGGLRVQSGMGAENPALRTPLVMSAAVDGTRRRNLQSTLLLMAQRTGGQAIVNTNDVGPGLERFARDFDNYYSLGYRAPISDRGRYHRIEVRLKEKRPGWRVRHREGYRDKSIAARMSDGVTTFLVHGYETNPLGVAIDLGQQSPGEDGFIDVAIRVRVPMDKLVLLPGTDYFVGRLRLYFGAVDEEGRDAELQELPFELRIPAGSIEVARKDEVVRVINATMRPGTQRLVVAVRDEISEERSIVGRYVRVGSS